MNNYHINLIYRSNQAQHENEVDRFFFFFFKVDRLKIQIAV